MKDAANTMYKFEVNRWLAKEKDDGQIERELGLSKSRNNNPRFKHILEKKIGWCTQCP